MKRHQAVAASLSLALLCPVLATAQLDPRLAAGLRWRCIGPFRGGRTVAAVGIPGQRHEFLIGVNHGINGI